MTDIVAGSGNSVGEILGVYGDELYFTAGGTTGSQLWKIAADGTQVLVKDFGIDPPIPGVGIGSPQPTGAVIFDGELHFQVQQRDQSTGIVTTTLWQVDSAGTLSETPIPLWGLFYNIGPFFEHAGKLYFKGQNGGATNSEPGVELWSLDGPTSSRR